MAYQLSIITPSGKIYEHSVQGLVAPGQEGSFGVLSQHAPMVALLTKGVVKLKEESEEKYFVINSGILEVKQNSDVLLLADAAITSRNQEDAQAKLKNLN